MAVVAVKVADLAVKVEDTVVALEATAVVVVREAKPATRAAATATCPATALRARNATTAVRSVISPETAHLRPPPSEPAISASNLAMSRLNALTRSPVR